MSELWQLGAAELGEIIQRGEASSRQVVLSCLDRIDQINPKLNAITVVLHESALKRADEIDQMRQQGEAIGPLGGVPITVKENQDLFGSATTLGLKPLENAFPKTDSPHIAEILQAGAIPIGRTNMPEFGMRWHTTNGLIGATKNPWDNSLTPGGSSGGEAAAIASGMSPLGIGNDGAGSLRWPAQCCGISALKPSHGRVPVASAKSQPIPFAFQLLGVHGPMARKISDLRLCFQHMCSNSSGDPWHTRAPFSGETLEHSMRVGIAREPGGIAPHPGIVSALETAARQLEDAGYIVEELELPELSRASEIYTQIMSNYGRLTAEVQRAPVGVISEEYDQFWNAFFDPWEKAAGEITHDPMMERGVIAQAWSRMMEQTPLILAPIATQPAWKVGSDLSSTFNTDWLAALRSVVAINLLGLPSVALPIGSCDGLPHGVQIIGPRFREDLCLQAAESVESRISPITPVEPRF